MSLVLNLSTVNKEVLFAIGTNCAHWRVVPLNLVESIEALEIVPCRDHTHPLVKMYFKKPNAEDSMLFASLAIDIIRAARDAVVKVLAHVQAGGPTVRSDCVQCLRDCRVQSPEDFFACFGSANPDSTAYSGSVGFHADTGRLFR
jgi:hypothetical protein